MAPPLNPRSLSRKGPPMSGDDIAKVTPPARLRRDAYLYIRQSTL